MSMLSRIRKCSFTVSHESSLRRLLSTITRVMEDDQSFGRGFGDHWKRQGHAGRGRGHGDRGRGHRHYSHGDRGGSEWRGGRGGRGGGGGRGGRGGRGGHPNGLCGREIGLFYAAKSKAKKEMLEKQTRQSLDLNAENERNLSRLLSDVRSEPQAGSSQQDHRQRRPASSDSFEDSWKQYKSRGAQKRREMQTRKKQYVGFSADQAKNITGLVSGEERPCDEEVMQTESMEPKTEEPDFIPLEMDVNLEENILYKDEEDEDMSAFMQEYSRHKEANQQAEGHSTNAYEPVPAEPLLDHQFEEELKVKKQNRQYKEIFNLRKKLKAFKMKKDIVDTINKNQVVVISGDTGCGKTTQVAQFILDDYIQCGRGSNCHIVCTQPRRISAISVAERVAQERVEKCGAGTSSVGYQIRLENQLPRKRGSILYCTTGIVLRHMMGDSWLAGTSHVILDEIHERDLHSDFLMIILKDLMRIRSDLKVILMSATLNAEMFSAYFDNCPMLHIPGFTFHVEEFYLEDIVQEIGYSPKQSQHPNRPIWMRHGKKFQAERAEREKYMSWVIGQRFPLFAVEALSKMDFTFADVDLTVSLVVHICRHKPEGAILVFMPGWMEIKKTKEELEKVLSAANTLIIPLHSLLPTCNQKEVFNRPRQGVRKIIIATSIAETSITIDDIVYVVNSGKSKMKDFDPESNIATLQTAWLSRASARQRRGRAGRVQPGECYHLYTRHHEKQLRDYELPEMLRTRLEKLCLDIKMLKLGRIVPFISKAMQPPSMDALQSAANMLLDLNALDDNEDLTPLGYHLATMPLEPQTGKMLLFGAMFSCLNPILTIAASLSFKDAFYKPMDYDPSWVAARRSLADGCKSDHILIAKAFEAWEQACANGNGHQFCRRHFLQQNTLFMLAKMRKQFVEILLEMGFLKSSNPFDRDVNRNSDNEKLVRAALCAGLYPNVAKIVPDTARPGSKRPLKLNTKTDYKVALNPSSINETEREFPSLWLVYYLKMKTAKIYLYDCTAVSPYSLLLFGGHISMRKDKGDNCVVVDDWIMFKCSPQTARLVKELRSELNNLLERKITNPGVTSWDSSDRDGKLMRGFLDLISTEESAVSHQVNYNSERGNLPHWSSSHDYSA